MRILFCVADVFVGEPHGVLQLSAIARRCGHDVRLNSLSQKNLRTALDEWNPDVVAYSAMSPEIKVFLSADETVRAWSQGKRVLRIMGGAHATYFPEVLAEFDLDAICLGEGDNAFPEVLRRFESNGPLSGIANILARGDNITDLKKELISDLDNLPFIDRELYYEAAPRYRQLAMRGFMAGRGCPYDCSYCHNHAFKELFRGCGKIVRRRSVEHVLAEMKQVLEHSPHVRLIKISDDTFAHTVDEWLLSFLSLYKKEINLPFYCLMRSNTLTDKMAGLLREAGCISIGMSVESGNERIRNEILHRGLTDKLVISSFENAQRHGLRTYGNTLLALPGTSFADDLDSFRFTKSLKMTVPTFGIFSPYPKTRLYDFALELGQLPMHFEFNHHAGRESALNAFSPMEKRMQLNLVYLGTLFCDLPDLLIPLLKLLLRLPLGGLYKHIGTAYVVVKSGLYIFPNVYPKNPAHLLSLFWQSIRYFTRSKEE